MIKDQTIYRKNTHYSYCGRPFPSEQNWPKTCSHCHNTTFLNPTPVAVVLQPVELPSFRPTAEATEIILLSEPTLMAFPLHEKVVAIYFDRPAETT